MDAATNQKAPEQNEYVMMDKKGDSYPVGADLAEIINEGLSRLISRENDRDFIGAANGEIVTTLGGDIDITGVLGDIRVNQVRAAIINNYARLEVVLEDRDDIDYLLSDTEIATNYLIKLSCDGDDPLAPRVRECITLRTVYNIKWSPRNPDETTH